MDDDETDDEKDRAGIIRVEELLEELNLGQNNDAATQAQDTKSKVHVADGADEDDDVDVDVNDDVNDAVGKEKEGSDRDSDNENENDVDLRQFQPNLAAKPFSFTKS